MYFYQLYHIFMQMVGEFLMLHLCWVQDYFIIRNLQIVIQF